MSLPVIGQIRSFNDVRRALESLRGWFATYQAQTSSSSSTVIQGASGSNSSQFPNPITDQFIASADKWNKPITSIAPIVYSVKQISLSYEAESLQVIGGELAVNPAIFDRIVSVNNDAVFHDGNMVYV